MRKRKLIPVSIFFFMICLGQKAQAYDFVPTDMEWATWPGYCKARYVQLGLGPSKFRRNYPHSEIQRWQAYIGGPFRDIHHYCAAIVYLARAELAGTSQEKYALNNRAVNNATYTMDRILLTDQIAPKVVNALATAFMNLKRKEQAFDLLSKMAEVQPRSSDAVIALTLYFKTENGSLRALDFLRAHIDSISPPSAEAHYVIGLLYMDNKQYDEARIHAKKAYKLGYPLHGLKNRLTRAGKWE